MNTFRAQIIPIRYMDYEDQRPALVFEVPAVGRVIEFIIPLDELDESFANLEIGKRYHAQVSKKMLDLSVNNIYMQGLESDDY